MRWTKYGIPVVVMVVALGAQSARAGLVKTHVGFDIDPMLFAPVFIDFVPTVGGGGDEEEEEGARGLGGGGGPEPEFLTGEIVEARLTIDMIIEPGAPIDDMEIIMDIPIDDGVSQPIFPSVTFTPADFTRVNDRLFGTVSTFGVNGLIFPPNDLIIPFWTVRIPLPDDGVFVVYGEGRIQTEFDIRPIPEPSTIAILGIGAVMLRCRSSKR